MTEDQKKRAIELSYEGKIARKIREEIGVSSAAWAKEIRNDTAFETSLRQARSDALEDMADSLLTVCEEPDIYRARLKSDNMKWLLAKRKPSTYGDRVDLNVNHVISIGDALRDAKNRSRLVEEAKPTLLSTNVHNGISNSLTDNQSVNTVLHRDDDDIFD
jgi:hypothetical protein